MLERRPLSGGLVDAGALLIDNRSMKNGGLWRPDEPAPFVDGPAAGGKEPFRGDVPGVLRLEQHEVGIVAWCKAAFFPTQAESLGRRIGQQFRCQL